MGLEKLLENTPESYYYYMGLIMTDGCFYKKVVNSKVKLKKYSYEYLNLTLTLQLRDRLYLEKFAKFVERPELINLKNQGDRVYVNFTLSDTDSIKKIMKKFDMNFRKTYNPPTNLIIKDDNLFISFFIGMVDGDADINSNGDIRTRCHESWADFLESSYRRVYDLANCGLTKKHHVLPSAKKYEVNDVYGNHKMVSIACYTKSFYLFLKKRSDNMRLPVLIRKWNKQTSRAK